MLPMRDKQRTNNEQQLKIELLSQWKLEAEFRNLSALLHRFTPPLTQIMPSGTAPLMVGQNLTSLVSSLSQRLEGRPFFLVIYLPS